MKQRKRRYIVLRISNNGIYYNETSRFHWEQTNFPLKENFVLNEHQPIYWNVEMLGYNKKTGILKAIIEDYDYNNGAEYFKTQLAKHQVKSIQFEPINWNKFQSKLSYFYFEAFNEFVDATSISTTFNKQENSFAEIANLVVEKEETIQVDFQYPLNKTSFKTGFVELTKRVEGIKGNTTIRIENPHIIAEFDHIKPFFAKALNRRSINVRGAISIDSSGNLTTNCTSVQISKINENLITTVQRFQLKDYVFNPKINPVDKSLFTPDEYFDNSDKLLGNALRKSEQDLLESIFGLEGIRNKKQLIYLSGKLHNKQTALKFTLSPDFGFLFHVVGDQLDHFVWELLNTHATYIWSIQKVGLSLNKKYRLLEREINFVRDNGRKLYLSKEQSPDFEFTKINHSKINSSIVDGFPKWKMRLDECLI